jgi:hypothetical protein
LYLNAFEAPVLSYVQELFILVSFIKKNKPKWEEEIRKPRRENVSRDPLEKRGLPRKNQLQRKRKRKKANPIPGRKLPGELPGRIA